MSGSDWNRVYEENRQRLLDLLNDCDAQTDTAMLLIDKMKPLLEDLDKYHKEVISQLDQEHTK